MVVASGPENDSRAAMSRVFWRFPADFITRSQLCTYYPQIIPKLFPFVDPPQNPYAQRGASQREKPTLAGSERIPAPRRWRPSLNTARVQTSLLPT
jgi:hypothetical protein